MEFRAAIRAAREAVGARQVFSDPVERDGVTVIPAATVIGGAGGGWGTNPETESKTSASRGDAGGGGYGLVAWPAGAYEVRDGEVRWHPAIDVTRLVLCSLGAALLLARWLLKDR